MLRAAPGGWPQEGYREGAQRNRPSRLPLHQGGDDRRTEYKTRSTYGKEGDTLNLDIDPKTHPAWTGGGQQMLDRGGRVSRFNSRFGNLGLGGKK